MWGTKLLPKFVIFVLIRAILGAIVPRVLLYRKPGGRWFANHKDESLSDGHAAL